MSDLSALIIGATGATGKHLLREVLASNKFSRVAEYGRRVTPKEGLSGAEKLEQKVIDFEQLDAAELRNGKWDVVFITLGTTRKSAGGAEGFERIDRQYVLDFANAAKSTDDTHKQRLIYLSSAGADSKSRILYSRSKGLTEDGLAGMGYNEFISFRPGYLQNAERSDSRTSESLLKPLSYFASLFSFGSSLQIPVETLAKSIRKAGEIGIAGIPESMKRTEAHDDVPPFTVLMNREAIDLAGFE